MGDSLVARYWCYQCNQMVNPVIEVDIKCPYCDGGFVEEMEGGGAGDIDDLSTIGSDRALSLRGPIFLGMMGGSSRRRRNHFREENNDGDTDRDREVEALLWRRRRRRMSSAAFFQLLQCFREELELNSSDGNRESESDQERGRLILIDPFDRSPVTPTGSFQTNQNPDAPSGSSLGDYFVGPRFELLLQYLAEIDPNRHGTPPAQKEAVEALPTVRIGENLSCHVCLEEFDVGTDAKEMPCKHKFHSHCILPWLELHSSCPVCRFQMPSEVTKDSNANGNVNANRVESTGGGNDRRSWLPVSWPFSGLFSLFRSQSNGNSASSSSSSTSRNVSDGNEN